MNENELELIRSFGRDDAIPNPAARAAARDRLLAHIGDDRPITEPLGQFPTPLPNKRTAANEVKAAGRRGGNDYALARKLAPTVCAGPLAFQRVVRRLPADIEATKNARGHALAAATSTDRSYFDRLIHKPWGSEFRIYEDDLTEMWCQHIRPGHRTSLHCHAHKVSAMLCLEGEGTLSTCTGVRYALKPGVVLHIEPGAYHRSAAASTGLRLIEVDKPKNRFDLLRIEDDYRAVTDPYEGPCHAPLPQYLVRDEATPRALQPFDALRIGASRWARLRAPSATDRHRYAVQTGEQIRAAIDVIFAIALDPRDMLPQEITVLGPEAVHNAAPQRVYLTITLA